MKGAGGACFSFHIGLRFWEGFDHFANDIAEASEYRTLITWARTMQTTPPRRNYSNRDYGNNSGGGNRIDLADIPTADIPTLALTQDGGADEWVDYWAEAVKRDRLIAAQEGPLNALRCAHNTDTHVVHGGFGG